MLMYESAKVFHGRQVPLDGYYFDNIFVHFQPKFNRHYRRFLSVYNDNMNYECKI